LGAEWCQIHYAKGVVFCVLVGLKPGLCYWLKLCGSPTLAWIYTNTLTPKLNFRYVQAVWKMRIIPGFPRAWTAATVAWAPPIPFLTAQII